MKHSYFSILHVPIKGMHFGEIFHQKLKVGCDGDIIK